MSFKSGRLSQKLSILYLHFSFSTPRKRIILAWKWAAAPTLSAWKDLVSKALPFYKATYRGLPANFDKVWGSWVNAISTVSDWLLCDILSVCLVYSTSFKLLRQPANWFYHIISKFVSKFASSLRITRDKTYSVVVFGVCPFPWNLLLYATTSHCLCYWLLVLPL